MSDLLIKNVPNDLHAKIQSQAKRNRRSVTQEVLTILEKSLQANALDFPKPVEGRRPLTQRLLTKAIREGRS